VSLDTSLEVILTGLDTSLDAKNLDVSLEPQGDRVLDVREGFDARNFRQAFKLDRRRTDKFWRCLLFDNIRIADRP